MIAKNPFALDESAITTTYNGEDMFPQAVNEIERQDVLYEYSYNELKHLRKLAGEVLRDKYNIERGPAKYGNLPRHFNEEQLALFFDTIRNEDIKAAFRLMFTFALRVGELSTLEEVPYQRLVRIHNEKCDRDDYLPIYDAAELALIDLETAQKYSVHYLDKAFRAICRDAGNGLDFVYGKAKPTKIHPEGRKLYQFTTQTLRHTAINLFGKRVAKDSYLLCGFSRHEAKRQLGTSAVYRKPSLEEIRDALNKAFPVLTPLCVA